MTESGQWRNAVTVVRAASIDARMHGSQGGGRATVFDFAGTGADRTWIGRVSLKPGTCTGCHHHGRHEVMLFVVAGRIEIRWGVSLEFAADLVAGDFAHFAPHVPHQERTANDTGPVELLVVRSDNERIAVPLDAVIVDRPEFVG